MLRISFDLDDTLICYGEDVPSEAPIALPWSLIMRNEPLRFGFRALATELRKRQWEIWVYTTSQRSPRSISRWLRYHGIHLGGVINQQIHEQHVRAAHGVHFPSKNPRLFGIDLHVDDSEGVRQEGEMHGFEVVVIEPTDRRWTTQVLEAAERVAAHKTVIDGM